MSRYSNCFACLTIMLVCASSSSQPTYRSIETFLRGTRQALLLQLCLSCIQVHISVKRPCLLTHALKTQLSNMQPASSKCSSATLLTSSPRSCHTRHQMAHSCHYNRSWKATQQHWLSSKAILVHSAPCTFEYTK